jgi:hypothetical protein
LTARIDHNQESYNYKQTIFHFNINIKLVFKGKLLVI